MFVGALKADIRVVPYGDTYELEPETEVVRRLTKIPQVAFLVIDAPEPAVVLGAVESKHLAR